MKSILFTGDMMYQANIGNKTQTRRVMRPQPKWVPYDVNDVESSGFWSWFANGSPKQHCANPKEFLRYAPYQVGDILAARSTWAVMAQYDHLKPSELNPEGIGVWFWYDGALEKGLPRIPPKRWEKPIGAGKSRPGRFLPKTLWHLVPHFEVTAVRAERVQDISEEDAIAEGTKPLLIRKYVDGMSEIGLGTYRDGFAELWDSINAKRGYPWEANDWVWVYEFKKV